PAFGREVALQLALVPRQQRLLDPGVRPGEDHEPQQRGEASGQQQRTADLAGEAEREVPPDPRVHDLPLVTPAAAARSPDPRQPPRPASTAGRWSPTRGCWSISSAWTIRRS